jgi:FkbM family methyltransferase
MKKVTRFGVDFLVNDNTENKNFWGLDSWEYDNYKIINEHSKNHTTFVNAGGWIGPFTLYSSKLFKNVLSLEPDSVAFNELKENVKLNNFENVKIFNKAFHKNNGIIEIGSDYSNLGGSGTSIFQQKNSIKVESVTLRHFFETEEIEHHSFLMLDVEGSEYLLFEDYDFFKNYRPTILLSLHLTFLTDENYSILYNSLEKLLELYNFDLNYIKKCRETQKFNTQFNEINILMKLK